MWVRFLISIFVTLCLLYAPGYLYSRALRLSRMTSFITAPVFSIAAYCVLAVIYGKLGIYTNWASLAIPVFALGAVLLAICMLVSRSRESAGCLCAIEDVRKGSKKATRLLLVAYLTIGVLVTVILFVTQIGSPNASMQTFDNVYHLGLPVVFAESGNWSSLSADIYADTRGVLAAPINDVSFYPAAWHTVCALLIDSLGVSSAMAQSTLVVCLTSIVFPSSMFLFMVRVFRGSNYPIAAGSLTMFSFAAFPWGLFVKWPLPPNAMAFCLVPLVLGLVMMLFDQLGNFKRTVSSALVLLAGIAAIGFSQPNSVFTVYVIMGPYVAYRAWKGFGLPAAEKWIGQATGKRVLLACGCTVVLIALWTAFYYAPPFQTVVQNSDWSAYTDAFDAFYRAMTFGFVDYQFHVMQMILVLLGIAFSFIRREHLWISLSFLLTIVIYVVCSSAEGFIHQYFAGFWYADQYRISAFVAIVAMPLSALGFWGVIEFVKRMAARMRSARVKGIAPWPIAASFVIAACLLLSSMPDAMLARELVQGSYQKPWLYDKKESSFVKKAMDIIPEGSLVLNDPFDGSALAYSQNHLHVYNRYFMSYGTDKETEASKLFRMGLDDVQDNPAVRAALLDEGIDFILQLDKDVEGGRIPGREKDWLGLDGFDGWESCIDAVLQDKDMVLYKVDRERLAEMAAAEQ